MPPRKRKAPPKLKTVVESPVKEEEPQQAPQVELQESPDNAGNVLSKIDDEVAEHTTNLLEAATKIAGYVRDEGPIACLRIPKKVRDMSIADFFGLSPEEASGSVLTNILSRLCLITGETKPSNTAGESAPLVEVALAVPEPPATRSTRRTAARTAAAQTAAKAAAAPPTTRRRTRATKTQAEQQAEALQPEEDTQIAQQPVTHEAEAGAQPSVQAAASKPKVESAAMPPPPWPAPGRRAQRGEVVYSANGSPLVLPSPVATREASTPTQPSLPVEATPAAVRNVLAPATVAAANMMNTAARGVPGGASVMAGFTLMKRTQARGRTRGARTQTKNENAIMISTTDGKQFLVDEGVGLACVPEQYRNEVAAQLEVMQRLAAAALNRK